MAVGLFVADEVAGREIASVVGICVTCRAARRRMRPSRRTTGEPAAAGLNSAMR
jgi:hypothetical protein